MLSFLIGLSVMQSLALAQDSLALAQNDGALGRIQAQKTFRAQMIERVQNVVGLFEDAEERLGVGPVADGFVRGMQTQRMSEAAAAPEKLRALSDEQALALKNQIRAVYQEAGSRTGLRTLRNAERRTASVQEQLIELTQENAKLDTTADVQRMLSDAGGSVSSLFRGVLLEMTRSGSGMFDFLYPFHLLDGLWSSYRYAWYEKVLVTPFALIGDLILLPFQGILWFGIWVSMSRHTGET